MNETDFNELVASIKEGGEIKRNLRESSRRIEFDAAESRE